MARSKRFNFSEFGKKKLAFPRSFEFLEGFRFYSIVEHTVDGRIQRRIEVLPTILRRTIEHAAMADGFEAECKKLKRELTGIKREHGKKLRNLKSELNSNKEDEVNRLLDERQNLERDLKKLKNQYDELGKEYKNLERTNEILMSRSSEDERTYSGQRSPKSIFDKADEGTKFRGPGLPGGLPGLGKNSR